MDEQEHAWPRLGAPRSGDGPAGQDAPGAEAPDATGTGEGPEAPDAQSGAGESEGPRPLGVGVAPTGHEPVDERLRRLEDADHLAVPGHLEVYEDVHRGLRDTLTALDRHEQ